MEYDWRCSLCCRCLAHSRCSVCLFFYNHTGKLIISSYTSFAGPWKITKYFQKQLNKPSLASTAWNSPLVMQKNPQKTDIKVIAWVICSSLTLQPWHPYWLALFIPMLLLSGSLRSLRSTSTILKLLENLFSGKFFKLSSEGDTLYPASSNLTLNVAASKPSCHPTLTHT